MLTNKTCCLISINTNTNCVNQTPASKIGTVCCCSPPNWTWNRIEPWADSQIAGWARLVWSCKYVPRHKLIISIMLEIRLRLASCIRDDTISAKKYCKYFFAFSYKSFSRLSNFINILCVCVFVSCDWGVGVDFN